MQDGGVADIVDRYRRLARTYDLKWSRLKSRAHAVELLELRTGDVVIDAACGTGLSFPFLERVVGPSGRVIGVDITPEMFERAQRRVEEKGWKNVELILGAAGAVSLPTEEADAVLFHLTPGITDDPEAVANVLRHCRAGARVVAVGPKWFPIQIGPLRALVWLANHNYVDSFANFDRPWNHLERAAPDLRVKTLWAGMGYMAWGHVPASDASP